MVAQTTLARSTSTVAGWTLDVEAPATVRFHPAAPGSGVVFTRRDLPGAPEVPCCPEHIRTLSRWSSLEHDGIVIHHTEHILAAIAGLGLDNVRVELDGDRIPVVTGGSCLGFSQALALAGRVLLPEPRTVFRLKRPFEMNDDLDTPAGSEGRVTHAFRHVLGTPASEFSARYYFQVPTVPAMPSGLAEFAEGRDDFMTVLASARTYYLRVEQPELSRLLSSARHEYIVLDEKSSWELVHEVARHKLVDFWGDLRLLGKPLRGRFVAHRTGHGFHHELVRRLVYGDYLETLELAESKVSHDHD